MTLELAYNIIDILQTMQDAVKQMQKDYAAGDMEAFHSLSMDVWDGLTAVQQIARQEVPEGSKIRLADACTCGLESLKDIKRLAILKPEKAEWKLEYELSPIIETTAMQFFHWGIVEEHPEKREEFQEFIASREAFEILRMPEAEWEYEYDLVIIVTAYNHSNYTKMCVQSILANLPQGVKSQLILFNHGSSDDTKSYFESMDAVQILNLAVNGAMPIVGLKVTAKGKYYLAISNDIVMGENAIENLYRCVAEHEDYGYIVPTTPAVSNFQTIPIRYESQEEFMRLASENNIYNERLHEQRTRLCNPLHIMPSKIFAQMILDMYEDRCSELSFPDDKNSLWMRRHGYKNILAKDAYCHHFGSVTLKHDMGAQLEREKFYKEGRIAFFERYGVDPWGTGFCYDWDLFRTWEIPVIDNATVLGINCGLGSNSLKVKEVLREKGAQGVVLYNATQEERYLSDLKGVSDEAFVVKDLGEIAAETGRKKYNYIVVEDKIQGNEQESPVQAILNAGLTFDELAYKTPSGQWKIFRMRDVHAMH